MRWLFVGVAWSLAGAACAAPDGGTAKSPSPEVAATAGVEARLSCLVDAVIEDGENRDNQVRKHDGRDGYIYTFGDDGLSTIMPPRGATYSMSKGGANGSAYTMRIHGRVGKEGLVFGGLGINLVEPRSTYDASKYAGFSFWARRSPGTSGKVRVKVPDANTDEQGGACTECFNDFGVDIAVGEQWDHYVVPFEVMSQLPGWGDPRPGAVDASRIYAIQFQVDETGEPFDLFIDDLTFLGCP